MSKSVNVSYTLVLMRTSTKEQRSVMAPAEVLTTGVQSAKNAH